MPTRASAPAIVRVLGALRVLCPVQLTRPAQSARPSGSGRREREIRSSRVESRESGGQFRRFSRRPQLETKS